MIDEYKEYKINSNSLKNLIGEVALVHDNFYSGNSGNKGIYKSEPDTCRITKVRILNVRLIEEASFMEVEFENLEGDHRIRTLLLRRNGVSINYNDRGKYEHYFTYNEMRFHLVVTTSYDDLMGYTSQSFIIPNSFKSVLVSKYGKLDKNLVSIKLSKNSYKTTNEIMNLDPESIEFELLYDKEGGIDVH